MSKRIITISAMTAILFVAIVAFAQVTGAQVENSKLKSVLSNKADSYVYVVLMAQDPAITYEGGIPGLYATKPGKSKKINPGSAHVKKYREFLTTKHDAALQAVGVKPNKKIHDYSVALNGFAAQLSAAQADALLRRPGTLCPVSRAAAWINSSGT